ncbi:MAG: EthD domain-containing protein [Myxococcota bacterium]
MKTLALIVRKPGLEREAFRDHYEQVHAPLAIETVLEGTKRYLRHHVAEVCAGAFAADVVTSFWYHGPQGALDVQARLQTPVGERILQDEVSFMDRPANTFFAVEERWVEEASVGSDGTRVLALVKRAGGEAAADFVAEYESKFLSGLLDTAAGPRACLQNRALGSDPAYDLVTEVHATEVDAGGLAAWHQELTARGAQAAIVRVTEHESVLPW